MKLLTDVINELSYQVRNLSLADLDDKVEEVASAADWAWALDPESAETDNLSELHDLLVLAYEALEEAVGMVDEVDALASKLRAEGLDR